MSGVNFENAIIGQALTGKKTISNRKEHYQ